MKPWDIASYSQALKNSDLLLQQVETSHALDADDSTDLDKRIAAKFEYAGSCARYMLEFTTELTRGDIESRIESLGDLEPYLDGSVGDKAAIAVNHLFHKDKDRKLQMVSAYVVRRLSTIASGRFIKLATRQNLGGSFDGHVYQMDFTYKLKQCKGASLSVMPQGDTIVEDWDVRVVHEFYDVKEIKHDLKAGDWLVSTKVNQGCYDAVMIADAKKNPGTKQLRFIQLTVGATHSLFYDIAVLLMRHLEQTVGVVFTEVDYVFVIPSSTKKFKPEATRGFPQKGADSTLGGGAVNNLNPRIAVFERMNYH